MSEHVHHFNTVEDHVFNSKQYQENIDKLLASINIYTTTNSGVPRSYKLIANEFVINYNMLNGDQKQHVMELIFKELLD